MARKNDDNIMKLKEQIQKKKEELSSLSNRVYPKTNCMLVLDRTTFNLHVDSSEWLLVRLNAYAMSAKDLGLDLDSVQISGFTLNQWIQDVRSFLQVQKYKEEKKKLGDLEKKLDALLSDDKRTELEINKIAAMLND